MEKNLPIYIICNLQHVKLRKYYCIVQENPINYF